MVDISKNLKNEISLLANPKKAEILKKFFKTGKGQYGEGDIFLGIQVPDSRKIARKYSDISWDEIIKLLKSAIHEERLIALFILVRQFEKGDESIKDSIFKIYVGNIRYINNWDLVDLSADKIVGSYLFNKPKGVLQTFAISDNLWERRIAIMATFNFIKKGNCEYTLEISKILLNDKHDLIHKAVGWMLREVGKRCSTKKLEDFLKINYKKMPRTMLRYAIERFPEELRQKYLNGTIGQY
jgi:3-methyladenine DNA glycosylase AlkD